MHDYLGPLWPIASGYHHAKPRLDRLRPDCQQVEDVTAMAVKTARVLLGTYSVDGPRYLTSQMLIAFTLG